MAFAPVRTAAATIAGIDLEPKVGIPVTSKKADKAKKRERKQSN